MGCFDGGGELPLLHGSCKWCWMATSGAGVAIGGAEDG